MRIPALQLPHTIFLAFALMLAGSVAMGKGEKQLSQYVLETWQAQQGLTQSTIERMERTSDGYLWLATHGGLVSYDGYRFRTFSSEKTEGLKSDTIYSLRADGVGRLWIGTNRGLSLLENRQFRHFDESDGLPSDVISDIELAPEGMWIATNQGLCWWQGYRCVKAPFHEAVGNATVRDVFRDRDGGLWIGILDGLVHFSKGRSRLLELPTGSNSIRGITQTPDGDLWFGTAQGCCVGTVIRSASTPRRRVLQTISSGLWRLIPEAAYGSPAIAALVGGTERNSSRTHQPMV